MRDRIAPTGVLRTSVGDLGHPTELLRALPPVERLVALLGAWRGAEALVAWDPLHVLDDPFECDVPEQSDGDELFGGGWIGAWGYQLGGGIEDVRSSQARPVPQPTHRVAFYDRVLRQVDGHWWLEQLTGIVDPDTEAARARSFRADLAERSKRHDDQPGFDLGDFSMVPTAAEHTASIAEVIDNIHAGEVFQANLTTRLEASFTGDRVALFAQGVDRLAPAYAAYVASPEGAIASLSPELFLRRRGRHVMTSPIKGTAALGTDPRELESSSKNRAENLMIVDLMRNDLGRVAQPGSVTVTALTRLETHAVHHLVSDVTARLRPEVTDGDLLRATFPPGSVTGAPKIRAMQLLSELEPTAREAYTGAIGYVSPYAGLELNVAIRTFEIADGRIWLGVGGGIVADSDPQDELDECLAKATPLLDAVGASLARAGSSKSPTRPTSGRSARPHEAHRDGASVFESLLVHDGRLVDPEPHYQRLDSSLRALHGVGMPDDLPGQVEAAAASLTGRHRVRVDVRRTGGALDTALSSAPLAPNPAAMTLSVLRVPGGLGRHKLSARHQVETDRLDQDRLVVDADGTVLEAGRAAIFAVVDDEICVPSLDGRVLPSTERERIARRLRALGLPLVVRRLTLGDLARASEVFTANALRGVVPVSTVVGVGTWRPGWVTVFVRSASDPELHDPPPARVDASACRVLVIDNFDSFVFNVVQHLQAAGAQTDVVRNDQVDLDLLQERSHAGELTHVVVSPGPGDPLHAGTSIEIVRRLGPHVPLLGVCLGHQAIAQAFGATIIRARRPMHGRPCLIDHDGSGLLRDLPTPLVVGRYHSLAVDLVSLPHELRVSALSPSGEVMGLRHRSLPIEGVQWHPESLLTPVGRRILDRFLAGSGRP